MILHVARLASVALRDQGTRTFGRGESERSGLRVQQFTASRGKTQAHATTGATALLLPAQLHTLYMTPYETRTGSMRELARR